VKYERGKYLKEFVESGIASPTALVFCLLLMEDTVLPSSFLFFSEFTLARSRRRLTGAMLASASNLGSMSESMIGEGGLDVARIDSGVVDGDIAIALERGVKPLARGGMTSFALTRAGYPAVLVEDVGPTLKVVMRVCVAASSR
jgi:hypothetical protein